MTIHAPKTLPAWRAIIHGLHRRAVAHDPHDGTLDIRIYYSATPTGNYSVRCDFTGDLARAVWAALIREGRAKREELSEVSQ